MAIDQHHDPGFGTLKTLLRARPNAYEHVKTASFDYDERKLPESAFAWPAKRLYPVHTEKQAAMSFLYADADPTVPTPVKQAIKEALDVYGVKPDDLLPVAEKTAAASPEECLFPEERTYPVRNATEVKYAEQRLLKQLPKLATERRAQAFVRLTEKAASLGVELSALAHRYAGRTQTDPGVLAQALHARAGATKEAGLQAAYQKLASMVQASPNDLFNHDVQVKIASTIHQLDEKADFFGLYDKRMQDPVATVFNTTKLAEPMMDLGGRMVAQSRMLGLGPDFYKDALGPDFLPEITSGGNLDPEKLAAVIETLPLDMKRNLSKYIGS